MSDREKLAEKYRRQELSEYESVNQHDKIQRAFLAGWDARDKLAKEEAKPLIEALEFYAGLKKDAHWEGPHFVAYDKFGGLDSDASGPLIARAALAAYREKTK